jgi:hypothetical protein
MEKPFIASSKEVTARNLALTLKLKEPKVNFLMSAARTI